MQTRQAPEHTLVQRGDAPMNKKEKVIPNIVETYYFDGATVNIADNFIARTDEEKAKVDAAVKISLMRIFTSIANRPTTGEQ